MSGSCGCLLAGALRERGKTGTNSYCRKISPLLVDLGLRRHAEVDDDGASVKSHKSSRSTASTRSKRGDFSSGVRDVTLAMAVAARTATRRAVGWLLAQLQRRGLEYAHIIDAVRTPAELDGILRRETSRIDQLSSKESIASPANCLLLPQLDHQLFDASVIAYLPIPNHGWVSKVRVRAADDPWTASLQDGKGHLPLAEDVMIVHLALDSRLDELSDPCVVVSSMRTDVGEEEWGPFEVEGPRAAFLAYAAVVRMLRRVGVLEEEFVRWMEGRQG